MHCLHTEDMGEVERGAAGHPTGVSESEAELGWYVRYCGAVCDRMLLSHARLWRGWHPAEVIL